MELGKGIWHYNKRDHIWGWQFWLQTIRRLKSNVWRKREGGEKVCVNNGQLLLGTPPHVAHSSYLDQVTSANIVGRASCMRKQWRIKAHKVITKKRIWGRTSIMLSDEGAIPPSSPPPINIPSIVGPMHREEEERKRKKKICVNNDQLCLWIPPHAH